LSVGTFFLTTMKVVKKERPYLHFLLKIMQV